MIRALRPFFALLALAAIGRMAQAETYTWQPATSSTWNTAGNWLDSGSNVGVPTSANTTALVFNASGTQSYTATNDIGAATFTLNRLTVNNSGSGTVTINGAAATNTLTFAGADPTLDITGTTLFTGLLANATTLRKTGSGTFIHDSNNTAFAGTLTIDAGRFVNRATSTAVTNFNPVSIIVNNGGTYQFGENTVGDPNLPNSTYITINSGGTVDWQEGENFGGFHLQGGTLNLSQGAGTAAGTTAQSWTSGTLTGGAFAVGGTVAINKTTTGTVTINGSASIATTTGGLNIQDGTIAMVNAANLGTSNITLGNTGGTTAGTFEYQGASATRAGTFGINLGGGTISVTNSASTLTLSGAFSGSGNLSKTGAGTLNLTGALGATGTTTVSAGTLRVNPVTASGGFAVAAGGTLAVNSGTGSATFTAPTLALGDSTATVRFELNTASLPTSPLVTVSNANGLTANGVTVALVNQQSFATGNYTLFAYNGSAISSGFTLALAGRTVGNIDYSTAGQINAVITGSDTIKWGGQLDGNWDVGSAANVGGTFNWKLVSNGNSTNFIQGDTITFDDSAVGNFTVNVTTTVNPASIAVDNTANDYTFSGSGAIAGSTGLTKTGTAKLVIANTNTFTGTTTVSAGILQLGNGGTTGSVGGGIAGSGTLTFNRTDDFTVANSLSGALNITKTGSNTVALTGTNSQTGIITLSGGKLSVGAPNTLGGNTASVAFDGGTLQITATHNPGSTNQVWTFGANGGTVEVASGITATKTGNTILGSGAMRKTGDGSFFIGSNASSYSGAVTVDAGRVVFTSNQLGSASSFTVNSGGTYEINDDIVDTFGFASGATLKLNGTGAGGIGAFRLTAQSATSPTTTFANAIELQSDTLFTQVNGTSGTSLLNLTGAVSGSGALTKNGNGVLALSTSNGYTGVTTISAGTLGLGAAGSINSTPSITVASGAIYNIASVTGGYTLGSTSAQKLTGTGTVVGNTTVGSSGTIQGGDASATGTLAVTGNLTIGSGGTISTKLADTALTTNSIAVSGAFAFDPNGNVRIDSNNVTLDPGTTYTYKIATSGSDTSALSVTDQARFSFTNFANSGNYTYSLGGNASGDILLTFTPVPEPGTLFGLGAAGFALLGGIRRWRNRR